MSFNLIGTYKVNQVLLDVEHLQVANWGMNDWAPMTLSAMQAAAATAAALPDMLDKIAEQIGIGAFLGLLKSFEQCCSAQSQIPPESTNNKDHQQPLPESAGGEYNRCCQSCRLC